MARTKVREPRPNAKPLGRYTQAMKRSAIWKRKRQSVADNDSKI